MMSSPPPERPGLPDDRRRPSARRLAPDAPHHDEILVAHERALLRGDDGYLDPGTGLFVLTAATLWARGTCCDSGCRHCPYVDGDR